MSTKRVVKSTSPSTQHLQGEEVPVELELIGLKIYLSNKISILYSFVWLDVCVKKYSFHFCFFV